MAMNDIPSDTINESFSSKGELQPGSLVFEADLKYAGAFQSMEVAIFLDGKRVQDRGLYSFYIAQKGSGSYVKFQFSDADVAPSDNYKLEGTIHFWIKH
jgi:hypothetical protein